jgi:very-short-patch-repair endonuclease
MTVDATVAAIAVRQHGLVSREQALRAGLTPRMIQVRIAQGRWILVRRGVYLIAGSPPSERQAVLAACLASAGTASHLTAASLWGLDLPAPHRIEVVGSRVRLAGVRSHRSETLIAADRTRLGAISLTNPARTMVDCAGAVAPHLLGAVVDDALRRGLVKLEALRRCHERIDTGPGRRHVVAMREVLAKRAPGYSAGDSERELDIVRLLADAHLPAPVLGQRVRIGKRTYKLDISWPEALLAIEFDGWATHKGFTAFHRDRNRIRRIITTGWTVLPVTAETDLHELVGDVTHMLSGRLATG